MDILKIIHLMGEDIGLCFRESLKNLGAECLRETLEIERVPVEIVLSGRPYLPPLILAKTAPRLN